MITVQAGIAVGVMSAATVACAQPVHTVFNSFGAGNSFDPAASLPVRGVNPPAGTAAGAAFMVDLAPASEGSIRSIELALEFDASSGGDDSFIVSVHEGDEESIGPVVWSQRISIAPMPSPTPIVVNGTSPTPVLSTWLSDVYWLVVMPDEPRSEAAWHLNDQQIKGRTAVRHWDPATAQWGPWVVSTNAPLPAARIRLVQCYPNCDGSWNPPPILTIDDFTCFINGFAQATTLPYQQQIVHYANCDGSTIEPVLTVNDFTCFVNAFAQGCP